MKIAKTKNWRLSNPEMNFFRNSMHTICLTFYFRQNWAFLDLFAVITNGGVTSLYCFNPWVPGAPMGPQKEIRLFFDVAGFFKFIRLIKYRGALECLINRHKIYHKKILINCLKLSKMIKKNWKHLRNPKFRAPLRPARQHQGIIWCVKCWCFKSG